MKKLTCFLIGLCTTPLVASPVIVHQPAPVLSEWHYAGFTDVDNVYVKKNSYAYDRDTRYMIVQYRPQVPAGQPVYYTFSLPVHSCGAGAGTVTQTDFEGRKTFLPYYTTDRTIVSELVNLLCAVPLHHEDYVNDIPEH